MRGIRGAICADSNSREAIYEATQRLLRAMMERNGLGTEDISAAWFTMTPDLDADFPAYAARDMGWSAVPMLGAQESAVPSGHARAIRVLLLARGEGPVRHTYLGAAADMRPDLADPEPGSAADRSAEAPTGDRRSSAAARRQGRLAIIGLGLIGGSLGAAARRAAAFEEIVGYDRSAEALNLGVARGAIDRPAATIEEAVGSADLVVLAVPVAQILALLPRVGRAMRAGSVVTDVGSTKRRIVAMMERLPEGVHGVGGHPMAGRTSAGRPGPDPDLFRGADWALVTLPAADRSARARVERLVRAVGARPVEVDPGVHDRVVALTSHVPALLAAALTGSADRLRAELGERPFLSGPGLAGATRLADSEPQMAAEMLADNADQVLSALDRFESALGELRMRLREPERLKESLAALRALRSGLLSARGAGETDRVEG